jgi:uncharacterized protein YjiS (DUF1127 family)
MRKTINVTLLAILLVLTIGLIFAISAEEKPSANTQSNNNPEINMSPNDVPKLIEIIRVWKLIDEVELDKIGDEKLVKFLAKYRQLDKIRFDYHKDRVDSLEKLKKLLETNASDEQIKTALNDTKRIDETFAQREKQLLDTLNSSLTPKQQAEFIVFQDNHWQEMRQIVRNLKELSAIKERRLKNQPESLSRNP